MTATSTKISPGVLLRGPIDGDIEAYQHLNGFGGFHGGLALGLLTTTMRAELGRSEQLLRTATARFHRPLEGRFRIEVTPGRTGRTVSPIAAAAIGAKGPCITADAAFGAPSAGDWPVFTPTMPAAPPPLDLETFAIPPEFVAIAAYTEIRPVGPARPYAGGPEPELMAWIRLTEDDEPPDLARFAFLMDGLAPSYTAVFGTLALVPTIELTVRPAPGLADVASPWVLLRATTLSADAGGWTEERIDAWGTDGGYLGSARQLRVARTL